MESQNLEIKEEPFEELFVAESGLEASVDDFIERNELESCCLCSEGNKLQNLLFEHLQIFHDSIEDLKLSCCFCPEGLTIQTEIINHLLSHFVVKKEISIAKDSLNLTQEFNLVRDPTAHSSQSFSQEETVNRAHRDPDTKRFFCKLCVKSFQYKQGLQKHHNKEHNPANVNRSKYKRQPDDPQWSKIKCDSCPKLFKYKQGAQKHWDLEHNPSNTFECPKASCNSRCKTLKNLHAHLRTHDPPREADLNDLQCHKCLKVFDSQKQLSLHFYTHREKFFCCDICGSKFNNREQIKNHVLRHVGLFKKKSSHQRIICDQCSMMVYSHKMKRHKLIHHSDEKPFKCDHPGCNAAFSDSRILNDHQNIHLRLKPYKCEYCSESFRSGANLRLHRIRHTDPDRYRCDECQTSFVTKQALQKHNRRHTEDPDLRPYACEYPDCNSTFKQKDHVRNHIRRTHEKSEEIFFCEYCAKNYERKDALGKHLRKAHNICKRKSRVFPLAT